LGKQAKIDVKEVNPRVKVSVFIRYSLTMQMKKMVLTLKRTCDFVKENPKKLVELHCSRHISSVSKTTEVYLQRMRVFEVSRSGESATIKEITSKNIFNSSKKSKSRKSKNDSDDIDLDQVDGDDSDEEPDDQVNESDIY